jgi:hydroxymethylglutaryl-CoA lyase
METVKIIECPRDAWQGLAGYIPTQAKAAYLHHLVQAGFRHLDAVSFVSPKHVPQMADSEAVMAALTAKIKQLETRNWKLEIGNSKLGNKATDQEGGGLRSSLPFPVSSFQTEIIGIVVNEKGLRRALGTPGVTTIGYPHSISAHFLHENARISVEESRALVERIKPAVEAAGRDFVVYLSMAFGNPYGEPWHPEEVGDAVAWLQQSGIRAVSLADTVGRAGAAEVGNLVRFVRQRIGDHEAPEIGVHLHSRQEGAAEKVLAAYQAGCRRFDSTLTGLGGCPFAGDELVGNVATEIVIDTLRSQGADPGVAAESLRSALEATRRIRETFAEAHLEQPARRQKARGRRR